MESRTNCKLCSFERLDMDQKEPFTEIKMALKIFWNPVIQNNLLYYAAKAFELEQCEIHHTEINIKGFPEQHNTEYSVIH